MLRSSSFTTLLGLALVVPAFSANEPAPTKGAAHKAAPAKKQPTRPSLNIKTEPVPPLLMTHLPEVFKTPHGLVIREVGDGTAAKKAGLAPGQVLLGLAGKPVLSEEQLGRLLQACKEDRVEVTILDAGKQRRLVLPVEQVPVGRPRPVAGTLAFSSSTRAGQVSVVGTAGQFEIEVVYRDHRGKQRKEQFCGPWEEVSGKLDRLPRKLREMIRARIEKE